MNPKYALSPKRTIAAARCRQAMVHAFFCAGLFGLLASHAWAQNISPEARRLFQQADSAAALQSFDRSIEIAISTKDSARQAEAWFGKGRAHEAKSDTANAARSYRQSLRAQPDFKEARSSLTNLENQSRLAALYQMAEEAFRRKDWTTAAQNYRQILFVDPNFKDVSQKLAIVQNKIQAQADSAQALQRQQKFDEAINLLKQAINLDGDRRPDFQTQMNQIAQEKQLPGNKTKTTEPTESTRIVPPLAKPDTSVALEQDTTQKRSPIASKDSTNRQLVKPISENGNLTSALKWPAAIIVAIVVAILVFVLIGKYRTKLKLPEPTVTLPLPTELSQPESIRDLIKFRLHPFC